jgi:uncharacterized protein (TIGR02001 family)
MRIFPWALFVLATGATLNTTLGATTYVVTADFPYVSKYVFRGLPLAGASFQPSIRLAAGGNYAGVWLNQPFGGRTDPELDFNAGHNFPLAGGWTLDAGMTAYYFPQADSKAGSPRQTFEGYLGLNGSFGGTNVGASLFRDFDLHATTVQLTVGYSLPLNANATLSLAAATGGVMPDHGPGYAYCGVGAAVPCKLSDAATFTVGANWSTHDQAGQVKNNLWFTVGLTVTF